jgi:hypothetical protein
MHDPQYQHRKPPPVSQTIPRQPRIALPQLDDHQTSDSDAEPDGPTEQKSSNERVSDRRNLERVKRSNAQDASLLGKYLPSTVDEILPEILQGPDDSFAPPPWLFQAIQSVAKSAVRTPDAPPVQFDTTPASLAHNATLLREFDYDFGKFLAAQSSTSLHFGSEFRPVDQLDQVLSQHPVYPFFRDILSFGMDYKFT